MSLDLLITFPHSLGTPGGGTVGVLNIATHLARLGVKVGIVALEDSDRESSKELRDQGVRVWCAKASRVHYLMDAFKIARKVTEIDDTQPPCAVISWEHDAAFLPRRLRTRNTRMAMIAARPSYALWLDRRAHLRHLKGVTDWWFRWRPLRRADVVFALSEFTRRELIERLSMKPQHVVVAYWGVDEAFLRVPREYRGSASRLLFFGALTPSKGIFDLIAGLGRLRSLGANNWTLKLAGWGDGARVLTEIDRAGLSERVQFLGRLDHSDLRRELEWADLAVLPSHLESFGLAMAEAQAAGLPVIAYRTGAAPELVEDGVTGWLVEYGDVDALAITIAQAICAPEKTYEKGVNGRQRVRRLFRWEKTAAIIRDELFGRV